MDVVSKIKSIVITNWIQLVLKQLKHLCSLAQHQKQDFQMVFFSIKNLLQTRKETDKSAWVVFVDLIKAFDLINYELLFKILENFGISDRTIMVIKNFYKKNQD